MGYTTARVELTLGDGATGEVALEPEEDHEAVVTTGGQLVLAADQSDVTVTIDGRLRGVYQGPIRLEPGLHDLLVERGNFEPASRDFTIETGQSLTLKLKLVPTPEYRSAFVSRARTQRAAGIASIVAGAAVAAGGAVILVVDAGQRNDGNRTLAKLASESMKGSGQACDPGQLSTVYEMTCAAPTSAASSKVDDANTRDIAGWIGVGVGAAAAVVGAVLFATADDPHRYDDVAAAPPRLAPRFWAAPGGGGFTLAGSF